MSATAKDFMRYVITAVIGLVIGYLMVPVCTYCQIWFKYCGGGEAVWLQNFTKQTEPGRNNWYNSQPESYKRGLSVNNSYPPLEEEQKIINHAFDVAFQLGCLDNSYIVLAISAFGVLSLWTIDKQRKSKSNVT
jgi:hypothetical protein